MPRRRRRRRLRARVFARACAASLHVRAALHRRAAGVYSKVVVGARRCREEGALLGAAPCLSAIARDAAVFSLRRGCRGNLDERCATQKKQCTSM